MTAVAAFYLSRAYLNAWKYLWAQPSAELTLTWHECEERVMEIWWIFVISACSSRHNIVSEGLKVQNPASTILMKSKVTSAPNCVNSFLVALKLLHHYSKTYQDNVTLSQKLSLWIANAFSVCVSVPCLYSVLVTFKFNYLSVLLYTYAYAPLAIQALIGAVIRQFMSIMERFQAAVVGLCLPLQASSGTGAGHQRRELAPVWTR